MKTLAGTVHQGRVELAEQTELVEGQAVIVVVPDNQDVHLPAEAMKLLMRLDASEVKSGRSTAPPATSFDRLACSE
jgi:hypothetical protein